MAILIPAKNIYKKQYEKLNDNAIDLIQVKTLDYSSYTKDDVAYQESITGYFPLHSNTYEKEEFSHDEVASSGIYNIAFAYAQIQPYIFERRSFKLKKDEIKKIIISCGKLKFDVVCNVETGNMSAYFRRDGLDNIIEHITYEKTEDSIKTFTEFEFSETATANASNTYASATATIDTNVSHTLFEITDQGDYYSVNLRFVCGIKKYNLQGSQQLAQDWKFDLTGTYENIIPQQVNITIDGVVKTVDFIEKTNTSGNTSSKNAFMTGENNELMQSASRIIEGGKTTSIFDKYQQRLESFKKGKKILTLLCDINDYYIYKKSAPNYKSDVKAISLSSTRLTFKQNEVVVPMIKKADGTSAPIDIDENGEPMTFVVLAVRVFYDGAVWQELTLQQS